MATPVTTKVEPTEIPSGSNYIIFPNGLKMCWGSDLVAADTQTSSPSSMRPWIGGKNITFPITFSEVPCAYATVQEWASHWVGTIYSVSRTGGGLRIGGDDKGEKYISWFAIGY